MSYSGGTLTPHCGASSNLLIGLPEGTPQIKYTNMKKLRRAVEECCKDDHESRFLIVVDVPSTILQEFDAEYLDKGPRISANIQERILILRTMTKKAHEMVARDLEFYIRVQILDMCLREKIRDTGNARVTNQAGTFVKEPDTSFTPDGHEWPTLTIETGLSEKKGKLTIDARGWLESDGSETQVVITANIDRTIPRVTFDKWERKSEPQRVTRSSRLPGYIAEEV
ncbi:hypothetical protein FQN49_008437, partial [Arthroderma sp. PD_2]